MVEVKEKPPMVDEVVRIQRKIPTEFCLKPRACLDLFLHSRKTHWQSLMDRRNIVIRRVPRAIAKDLANYLTRCFKMDPIYFHKSIEGYHWQVEGIDTPPPDEYDANFPNVILRFKPSGGLKPLCQQIFKVRTYEYPIPKELFPEEDSYNPYNLGWTETIDACINYWYTNKNALSYAEQDIILLERLYHHFGCPEPGDNDSELAACVGAVRWHGYAIDDIGITKRLIENYKILEQIPINLDAPIQVKRWLIEAADEIDSCVKFTITSTGKDHLEKIKNAYPNTTLSRRCEQVFAGRRAAKEITILERLLQTTRFCPDFKVIGTKSGRMSGGGFERSGGTINPQGIQHDSSFRQLFTLADKEYNLSGGDFKSFEVAITHAQCNDNNLGSDLRSGKSFHGIFGASLYNVSYDEILASKGSVDSKYDKSKTSALALLYGAFEETLSKHSGTDTDNCKRTIKEIEERYPDWSAARKHIHRAFCAMRQPGGIGTIVEWHEPVNYIESLLGFKRYFTLENDICRFLYKLANDPRALGNHSNSMVTRKDRQQTISGATQSALYACCFQMQAANMRAGANHVIQSTGAEICKALQRAIWDLQPSGIHEYKVLPMNIHDEVMVVHRPELTEQIELTALKVVEVYREIVPLLELEWKSNMNSWAEK